MTGRLQTEAEWTTATDRHRESIVAFVRAAHGVPASSWDSPLEDGKWSPGEVAEHLRLSYEALGRELAGGTGLQVRTPWWLRTILRWKFLPAILGQGKIPAGARAPREARPGTGPFPRAAVLEGLERVARDTEATLTARRGTPGVAVTHHVFGRLVPDQIIRFLEVHNAHHTRQLTAIPPGPSR